MIVTLLILIVLILLFGAAAVRGALGQIGKAILAFLVLGAVLIGGVQFLGETAFWWITGIGGVVLFLFSLTPGAQEEATRQAHVRKLKKDPRWNPPKGKR